MDRQLTSSDMLFSLLHPIQFLINKFHLLSCLYGLSHFNLFTQLCFKINHHIPLSISIIHESLGSGSALLSCYVNYFRLSYAALTWIYANMAPAPN
ncbi:hypothetical protein BDP27DRAFT_1345588 [Rhodocollybia butyracea]|uniref:Uncharacterized protein n=1 Tax=Rhodocollybia butyracea TaxID=206335 RepID=A0A9P5P6B6_9AGAR|nr:hypothetical protein BDP27DRAFT_1345588 [Rhodocollybia butyracea]